MNDDLAVFLIALVISIILWIIKATIWAGLGWFWVLLPIMAVSGIVFLCFCDDGAMW